MTSYDLYKIKEGINKCSTITNVADINFAFLMAKIESEVDAELKLIEKARKPFSDKYKEYLKKKEELDIKYSIQKEDGTLHTLNGNLVIRNPKEYSSEFTKLNDEYKEYIDEATKIISEFEEFLQANSTIELTKLPKSCIPSIINVEQMKLLFPIIIDK